MIRWGTLVSPCWSAPTFCNRLDGALAFSKEAIKHVKTFNGNASKGVFATFWPTIISWVGFLAGLALTRGSRSTWFHNSSDQNDALWWTHVSLNQFLTNFDSHPKMILQEDVSAQSSDVFESLILFLWSFSRHEIHESHGMLCSWPKILERAQAASGFSHLEAV